MIPGVRGRDVAEILGDQGARRQHLPGFDDDYVDIVDYILRCTHRIWEEKDVGLIATHYGPDMALHTPTGTMHGAAGVIASTARFLSAFPDRVAYGEAVIWSEEAPGEYLSSHRLQSVATNTGPSDFGPPTGARLTFTTIADCLCRANLIVEEWLVRDSVAIARGLGLSPRALGEAQAEADRAHGPARWRLDAIARLRDAALTPFPGPPPSPAADAAAFVAAWVDAVWTHRRFRFVRERMSPAVEWRGPGGRRLFGHGEVTGWLAALVGSFGDLAITVEHVAANDDADGRDIAWRWAFTGTHDGPALYGAPSGRTVWVPGMTHWRVEHGVIVAEVMMLDEVALWRQLAGGL